MKLKDLIKLSLQHLGRRLYSTQEIRQYLYRKTSDSDMVDKAISYLIRNKFLNDAEFTRWYIESRSRTRPRGTRLLTQELKQKGILHTVKVDEFELAKKALEKKEKNWSKLKANDYRLKATRYLQYRGFSWDTIEKILKKEYND